VLANPDVLRTVQDAIEAVTCNFADNHTLNQGVGSPSPTQEAQTLIALQLSDVLPALLSRIVQPVLQRNLVCALPASSPLTAYLQRHLALAFLLHPHVVDAPLADPELSALIHKHLDESPHFRIRKNTNYASLAARITLLDIGLGPGPTIVPYQPLVSPAASHAGSSPVLGPLPASSEIKDFNREVDGLAQHIKMLGNSIVEAGAVTDLTILEAKDCFERLCARLEHAVRYGGKLHHKVFGDEQEMKQFKVTELWQKLTKARKSLPTRGIFDDEDEDEDGDETSALIEAEGAS
jgi:hypothetical protein